jgi:hypothetical protein
MLIQELLNKRDEVLAICYKHKLAIDSDRIEFSYNDGALIFYLPYELGTMQYEDIWIEAFYGMRGELYDIRENCSENYSGELRQYYDKKQGFINDVYYYADIDEYVCDDEPEEEEEDEEDDW